MATVYILFEGAIIEGSKLESFEEIVWVPHLFQALEAISSSGSYRLEVLTQTKVNSGPMERVLETLSTQGVVVEEVAELATLKLPKEGVTYLVAPKPDKLAAKLGIEPLVLTDWREVASRLLAPDESPLRRAIIQRETHETKIELAVNLDGSGQASLKSGLPFFDHMLEQIARHGRIDLQVDVDGDIEVDEHHTVEDVALVLGQAFRQALGDKRGIRRYGFEIVPMDECLAQVAIDFSGRNAFEWNVTFKRDMVGTFPTEMVEHFFKSFSDEAKATLHMEVSDGNTHHQIEALFKAFGRAVRRAVFRYPGDSDLPSTKGLL